MPFHVVRTRVRKWEFGDMPSFAPVVIVTSVSGFMVRPKKGEYASARAFFSRGLPCKNMSSSSSPKIYQTYLCWRILVAVHLVQRLLGGINHKCRRIVPEEALSHIDDRLDWRSSRSLIHDTPEYMVSRVTRSILKDYKPDILFLASNSLCGLEGVFSSHGDGE